VCPQRVLKVSDSLLHNRLRNRELLGCLRHAAPLDDSEKHVNVAQFEATADAIFPAHRSLNSQTAIVISKNRT
jgi:hypothetical protein